MKNLLTFCAFLAMTACASIPYDSVSRGSFQGQATVVWVGGGTNAFLGDGEFLYIPMPGQELSFARQLSSGDVQVIQPDAFYTDGGSIPRVVQSQRGFNAWGFGPAYIIHDWLFVARKCLNDEESLGNDAKELITPAMRELSDLNFRDSAIIMAELIKTLAQTEDENSAGKVISNVTSGPVTYDLWTLEGACRDQEVSEEHKELIAEITRQQEFESAKNLRSFGNALAAPADPQSILRTNDGTPYVVVGRYVFE